EDFLLVLAQNDGDVDLGFTIGGGHLVECGAAARGACGAFFQRNARGKYGWFERPFCGFAGFGVERRFGIDIGPSRAQTRHRYALTA
ncbi:hypothetical protein G3N59_33380, partial [Paraburkholderia sp. Ac-20340]|uniref:hypothetical protein n=1 Tax=Paraburkholderia sp. Ac-20340 TaxID=2703888 RepID=UPI00197FEDF7